jgi:acetyl esterase/lipase
MKRIAATPPVLLIALVGFVLSSAALAQTPDAKGAALMTPREFQALPSQPADQRIAYGEDPEHFGDLRVPAGDGPHPLAILVHGGCFTARYASLKDMAPIADALKLKGVATWNIEYRRLGNAGGGWPGTYLDVGRGVDHLRTLAAVHKLDLKRVIVIGHSAGGHLALWAAGRSRVPQGSALYTANPLRVNGVVDLAGPPDLEAFLAFAQGACGPEVVESFLGGKPAETDQRYTEVSAFTRLPLGIPQVLIWGERDDMNPIPLGETYLSATEKSGDAVKLVRFPAAGHFEIASPFEPIWPRIQQEILAMLDAP